MKRILLIKLTSLGDLIHALPALTDLHRACPEARVDWMIDTHFAEIAAWHPAIHEIFTTDHRQWGRTLWSSLPSICSLIKSVRREEYDLVIDGQGNFKTALLSLTTRGLRAGFDRQSVREQIASFAYQKKYGASKKAHAIDRLRQLFSLACGYPCPTEAPDFLIQRDRFKCPAVQLPERYLVFIHNAGWQTKLWPEEYWARLIRMATEAGCHILLPWGSQEEEARARRLAINSRAIVLPRLSLSEIGFVLSRAAACVCMDTGLGHLAAALNIPSLTLYGATDPRLIGARGLHQLHIPSNLSCAPCHQKKCRFFSAASLNPPCLAQISPERVWEQIKVVNYS